VGCRENRQRIHQIPLECDSSGPRIEDDMTYPRVSRDPWRVSSGGATAISSLFPSLVRPTADSEDEQSRQLIRDMSVDGVYRENRREFAVGASRTLRPVTYPKARTGNRITKPLGGASSSSNVECRAKHLLVESQAQGQSLLRGRKSSLSWDSTLHGLGETLLSCDEEILTVGNLEAHCAKFVKPLACISNIRIRFCH
jgi:hypothetical protein